MMAQQGDAPFDYAVLYFRTRDYTAVAENGDYEPITPTVTLYAYSPKVIIAVNDNKRGLHVKKEKLPSEDTLRYL
jgi:hypothetical protein